MSEQSADATERSWVNDIHQGDAAETLAEMSANSIHMAMCSPPYFGLRDYGVDGQIGLEDELDAYIQELVGVGRALRRVLRPDGSWWLNLGDSYAGSGGAGGQWTSKSSGSAEYAGEAADAYNGPLNESGFGRKNKMLVPHRVAIALQRDGWVVRNDVTWVKPNPMPQSVKDRLNTTTEQIFHLVPEADYWYDLDAIREPHAESTVRRIESNPTNVKEKGHKRSKANAPGNNDKSGGLNEPGKNYADNMTLAGKNPGDVFKVTTKPFPDAHFAVYPPELVEKPIKATCPPKVCVECGTPYEREVEIERSPGSSPGKGDGDVPIDAQVDGGHQRDGHDYTRSHISDVETVGWSKECDCDTDATQPGICLDPFAGAGSTLLKAKELGRRFVGIDLNPDYVALAQKRVGVTVDEPERLLEDDAQETLLQTDGGCNDQSQDTATDRDGGDRR